MPILALDTETQGLDARKFVCGATATAKEERFFLDKNEMWKYVIEQGANASRNHGVLHVYAHNMEYDFYAIANLTDRNLTFQSTRPFIASWQNGKTKIEFLDLGALYERKKLDEIAELIQMKKLTLPDAFKNGTATLADAIAARDYVMRDTKIVLNAILMAQASAKNNGYPVHTIYSAGWLAANQFIRWITPKEQYKNLLTPWKTGGMGLVQHAYQKEARNAYHGGRSETWTTENKSADWYDINNLYGFAAKTMDFPELTTATFLLEPEHLQKSKTGYARAIMENTKDEIGILPIRTEKGTYYPKNGTTSIGTWTLPEIQYAKENGWQINHIRWAVEFDKTTNPLTEYVNEKWAERNAINPYSRWWYKTLINPLCGKFGEHRKRHETRWHNIEETPTLIKNGLKPLLTQGTLRLFRQTYDAPPGRCTAPILSALIAATARIHMHQYYRMVGTDNLLYTDTDSIICKNGTGNKLPTGNELGKFRTISKAQPFKMHARKIYEVGAEMRTAGGRRLATSDTITSNKMKRLESSALLSSVGSFETHKTPLAEIQQRHIEEMSHLTELSLFIDSDIKDIESYKPFLNVFKKGMQ